MIKETKKGWLICLAGAFCYSFVAGIDYSFGVLLSPMSKAYHLPLSMVSFSAGIFPINQSLMGPILPYLIKKVGNQKLSLAGGILGAGSMLACVFLGGFEYFILFYGVFGGIASGLVHHCNYLAMNTYFDEKRSIANAIYQSAGGVGTSILSLANNFLINNYDLEASFKLDSVGFVIMIAVAPIMKASEEEQKSCEVQKKAIGFLDLLRQAKLVLYLISTFFFYLAMKTFMVDIVDIVTLQSGNIKDIKKAIHRALPLSGFAIFNCAGRILAGILVDLGFINCQLLVSISTGVATAAALTLSQVTNFEALVAMSSFMGLLLSPSSALCSTILVDLCQFENLTRTYGMWITVVGLAHIPGPIVGGLILDHSNGTIAVWLFISSALLICCITNSLSYFLRRKSEEMASS